METNNPMYIVRDENSLENLKGLVDELPIEIDEEYSYSDIFQDAMFSVDEGMEHDVMVYLDRYEERRNGRLREEHSDLTDIEILRESINPTREDVEIKERGQDLELEYSIGDNRRSAYIKFWDGIR